MWPSHPVSLCRAGWPPTPSPHPKLCSAGVRDTLIPSIMSRTTQLPPGEPRTCFTKDPLDTTLWRAAESPPHHLQTVFMYVCKIQPSSGASIAWVLAVLVLATAWQPSCWGAAPLPQHLAPPPAPDLILLPGQEPSALYCSRATSSSRALGFE